MDNIIEMQNVKKIFSSTIALENVSCTVAKGEIFGLLGPSGAGKTTIINILTGQIPATGGQAKILGVNTNQLTNTQHSQMGMVLDNSGLYTRLSVYDNMLLFAQIYGVSKKKISETLEKVGLLASAKKPADKLSKGMQKRLVLARAILHDPKLLFLDEPTSGLDPTTMGEIHKLIFSLRDNGATIFLTTHNMEEATKLCDHVALLNTGKIVEYGVPKELCRRYDIDNSIRILLKSGEELHLPSTKASAGRIAELFEQDQVASIHSSEPNLESVFIKLTGRELA